MKYSIENKRYRNLTLGNVYEPLKIEDDFIWVINDKNREQRYMLKYFKSLINIQIDFKNDSLLYKIKEYDLELFLPFIKLFNKNTSHVFGFKEVVKELKNNNIPLVEFLDKVKEVFGQGNILFEVENDEVAEWIKNTYNIIEVDSNLFYYKNN